MNETPSSVESQQRSNRLKLIWGLACLIGPTASIILAVIIYAVLNFAISTTAPSGPSESGDLFPEPNPVRTISNIVLFLVGGSATLTWLPGIVVGIILLATRKPAPSA